MQKKSSSIKLKPKETISSDAKYTFTIEGIMAVILRPIGIRIEKVPMENVFRGSSKGFRCEIYFQGEPILESEAVYAVGNSVALSE